MIFYRMMMLIAR